MEPDLAYKKCWGIGLPRTGTTSICAALRRLGYNAAHNPAFEQLGRIDSGADQGVVLYYKYLDYKYPGSKFILTLRDLDTWLPSVEYVMNKYPVRSTKEDIPISRRMGIFESVTFDRDKYIAAYHRHHEDVRRYFKQRPEDLLEMRILNGDGWEELCSFLQLPVPEVPFPHANKRS